VWYKGGSMRKAIVVLVATTLACAIIVLVFWFSHRSTVVEGTIEVGFAFDQSTDAPIEFTITGMTLIEKTGKRYTLAMSKHFSFVNRSNEPDNVFALGESGLYRATGKIISKTKVIEQLENQTSKQIIQVPEYDVFVLDKLERLE